MLRALKNKNAQAVVGEYTIVIFLVMAVVITMAVYFKRAVQARMRDAREYMITEVRERTDGDFNGILYREYEPYYGNTAAVVSRDMNEETRIQPGGSSGIFQKFYNVSVSVDVNSETAPPKDFNRTEPVN